MTTRRPRSANRDYRLRRTGRLATTHRSDLRKRAPPHCTQAEPERDTEDPYRDRIDVEFKD